MCEKYYEELKEMIGLFDFLDLTKLNNKSILFTGVNGLIGKYFVDFIMTVNEEKKINIKLYALARNKDEFNKNFKHYINNVNFVPIIADVCDKIPDYKVDYIVHAASPATPYYYANFPVETMKANFNGTMNLLEYSRKNNVDKFIFIASGEVYGSQIHDGDGFKEEQPGVVQSFFVRSCYTESKRAAETLLSAYNSEYGIQAFSLRLCFVYGPTYTEKDSRVLFQFLRNYLNDEDIIMKSNGMQKRSYIYVADVVSSILKVLIDANGCDVYNVSNPRIRIRIKDIAEKFVEISNNNIKLVIQDPKEEAAGYSPYMDAVQNPQKLIQLGWLPKIEFQDGLIRTINIKKLSLLD